jgi:hypothetical protein
MHNFREATELTGTVRLDASAKRLHITPLAKAGAQSAPRSIDYVYQLRADELTLTGAGKSSITLHRFQAPEIRLANTQVEFVAASGFNDAGKLLVSRVAVRRKGRAGVAYLQDEIWSCNTRDALVFLAQEKGLKKITLAEARGLIRKSTPVVVTYREVQRPSSPPPERPWKEMGLPTPDSPAALRIIERIVRPGTLVFVLASRQSMLEP